MTSRAMSSLTGPQTRTVLVSSRRRTIGAATLEDFSSSSSSSAERKAGVGLRMGGEW